MADNKTSPILRNMAPGRLSVLHILLIIAFGLAVLVPATLPFVQPLSSHEVLAAQPAREMLRDGHWIIQTFAGIPRYEKPPTTGWLVAGSMALFHSDSEWVVRLPAVLSGILCALFIAILAARWLGPTVGTLAALIQLTTVWVQKQATLAEADMPLTMCITAAFFFFALAHVDHPQGTINRRPVRWAFMAAAGLAFLFKGPVALLFIFTGCGLYVLLTRRWSSLRFFLDPIGLIILAILVTAWPTAALVSDPRIWGIWRREVFGYVGAETFGRRSPWLYFHDVPLMLLPWFGLLVVTAVKTVRYRLYRLPLTVLLLSWFIPGMLVLQWAAFKSVHYTFPLLPPASIAMAIGLIWWLRRQMTDPLIPQTALIAVTGIAGIAGAVVIGLVAPSLPASIPAILILCCAGIVWALLLERAGRVRADLIVLFATIAIGIVATDLLVLPHLKGTWARKEFAQRVSARVPPDQTLYLIDFVTDELIWHLHNPLRRMDNVKTFEQTPLPPEGIYALIRARTVPDLAVNYRVDELDRVTEPKSSDTTDEGSRLPVLARIWPPLETPATQPATTQATTLPER